MPVNGCYFDSMRGWSINQFASATDDFEIPPSTILATSMLTGVMMTNNGVVFSGIVEYRTRDPITGVDQTITVGDLSTTNSLAQTVQDSNVDSVTFGMMVWDVGGGGDLGTVGEVIHQVWFT